MAKIVIDGVTVEVNGDNNLLQECLSQGLDLPYFCWHPCMGSVGACRQCAVKQYRNADDKTGTLVMACMTPAADGTIISIEDSDARKFRAQVIESLMISHPHDCPVCEEGGECHLQDMTLMSGHNYRRYDKQKVTHRNQYLGPFIGHEMNRCITCYRCVRYYNDYAGGTDLSAQASHHHTYFGRQSDGCLESEFSGNLVEVCPTGVFTDATFSAHYSRKWDLQTAPSICSGCAVGCNTTPGERYGELRRVVNRYHGDLNGYFLCDRGRFGYGYVNSKERLDGASLGRGNQRRSISHAEATQTLDQWCASAAAGRLIGIGSPRASLEANVALMQRVGRENFYAGSSDRDFVQARTIISLISDPSFQVPSVREVEQADAVLIVGEDVTNTAPRIALALRQSVRNRADELASKARIPLWQDAAVRELAQHDLSPLHVLSGHATRLDDVAATTTVDSVDALAAIAGAIAHAIDARAPAPATPLESAMQALVSQVAADLKQAKRPLIVCGSGAGSAALLAAAANVGRALQQYRGGEQPVNFCAVVGEANTLGMALLVPEANSLGNALASMQSGAVDTAIVLENDLYHRAAQGTVDAALQKVDQLAVLDHLTSRTTEQATLLLPTTTFAEQEGCYVNYEGRAQLSMQVFISARDIQSAWRWLAIGGQRTFDEMLTHCESTVAELSGLSRLLPDRAQLIGGMRIPRQTHRYSGRTAMNAGANVHEGKQPEDADSVMAFSMEGLSGRQDSPLIASSWAPRWNSNQSVSKFQDEVGGHLRQEHPGVMLLPKANAGGYAAVDGAPAGGHGTGLVVIPAYQLFGSEELTTRTDVIAQRATPSYVALAPEDARELDLQTNDLVEVSGTAGRASYAVCVRSRIRKGTVLVFTRAGSYPVGQSGEVVSLTKTAGTGQGLLDNLIVSDLL